MCDGCCGGCGDERLADLLMKGKKKSVEGIIKATHRACHPVRIPGCPHCVAAEKHKWDAEKEECSCGCGPYDDTQCLRAGCPHCTSAQELNGRIHELKTDSPVFCETLKGTKTYEVRLNDRGYRIGDRLRLKETRYTGEEMKFGYPLVYTRRECLVKVVQLLQGPIYGLKEGWVIMGIEKC